MGDLQIDDMWTFQELSDPTKRYDSFDIAPFLPVSHPLYCSPFGIALQTTAAYAMSAEIRIQLFNYRQDPSYGKMWFGRNGVRNTIDLEPDVPGFSFLNTTLPKGQCLLWMWWPRYTDLFGSVGSGLVPAICAARAEIQSGYVQVFATTEPDQAKWSFTVL